MISLPREIVRRLDGIKEKLRKDGVHLTVHTGPPRKGKSTLDKTFCRYIDPGFSVNQVAFSASEFKARCVTAGPATAVSMDEAIRGGNARRAMSSENVDMMDWLAIWGHRNLYGSICYPKWSRLDRAIKDYVDTRIHHPVRGIAVWYDVLHPDRLDEPVLRPVGKFRFGPLPNGPFRAAYEARKAEFTTGESEPEQPKEDARVKLSLVDVEVAARRRLAGEAWTEIARDFGVTPNAIRKRVGERTNLPLVTN